MIGLPASRLTDTPAGAAGSASAIGKIRSLGLVGIDHAAFICGCGHSGTTLLATILSAHPDVYVPLHETYAFFARRPGRLWRLWRLRRATLRAGKRYLIEKTPRHINALGTIRREVRGARFVVMVRDGRDVTASFAEALGRRFRVRI